MTVRGLNIFSVLGDWGMTIMKRTLLFTCLITCAIFAFHLSASAGFQTASPQSPVSPEVARIDQIIKENRALFAQSRFEEVFPKAEEALALSQQIGDKARQSRSIMQIGTAAFHTGRTDIAIERFKQAALLAEQVGDANLQSLSLNSAATLLTSAAAYEEALYFYNKSLALRRQLKDRRGEAYVLASISPLYRDTGDLTTGNQLLQDALQIVRELKANGKEDKMLEDHILQRIAWGEYLRGNYAAAVTSLQNIIASETERTSGAVKFEMREFLGLAYITIGDYEKAAAIFSELLEMSRNFKVIQGEARALGHLGWAQFHLGKPQEAVSLLSQAITLVRQAGNYLTEGEFLSQLAIIQRSLRQEEAAASSFHQAVAVVERDRSRSIPKETSKGGIVATNHWIFAGAIDLLISLKKEAEAFEIAEAYHARTFLDVLTESRIDLRRELTAAQKQREEAGFNRIATIQKELWNPALARERQLQLQKELQQAERELEAFQLELRRVVPRYASVSYPQLMKPERIAKELLDADTALIEFVLSDEKSFAWVIYQGKLSSITLPPRQEIDALVAEYRQTLSGKVSALTVNSAMAKTSGKSQQLYQKLFAPLEPHLESARKLIVIPDGVLLYLPFEALARERALPANQTAATEYLLERFAISYAPSASALALIKTMKKPAANTAKGVIAFGDPVYTQTKSENQDSLVASSPKTILKVQRERGFDFNQLPYTRTEVNAITSWFPATERRVLLGAEAREERVKSENLSQYRYVHFAAHGMIDEEYPARSGIVLSVTGNSKEDGALQLSEVMRLKLNADLVTLSACRTGLGKLLDGEGMIGLTRAFLYAGSSSVVVSLWNVNDMATATLMKAFYGNLKKGLAKDEALRQAKLELIKGQKRIWRHPYFWAPFVLIGERQ
jgi:CHAT domain-containing protein